MPHVRNPAPGARDFLRDVLLFIILPAVPPANCRPVFRRSVGSSSRRSLSYSCKVNGRAGLILLQHGNVGAVILDILVDSLVHGKIMISGFAIRVKGLCEFLESDDRAGFNVHIDLGQFVVAAENAMIDFLNISFIPFFALSCCLICQPALPSFRGSRPACIFRVQCNIRASEIKEQKKLIFSVPLTWSRRYGRPRRPDRERYSHAH